MPVAMAALTLAALSFVVATAAEPAQQQSAAVSAMSLAEEAAHRPSSQASLVEKQEPGGAIGSYITNTLLPLAVEEKRRIDAEIQASSHHVDSCGKFMWSAEREVDHREKILQSDEGEKYECLAREHQLHKEEKELCDGWHSALRTYAGKDSFVFPEPKDRKADNMASLFDQADTMAKHMSDINTKKYKCANKTHYLDELHKECVVDEETIQKFYCSMLYQRDLACAEYAQCYAEGAKEVEKVEAKMKELEATNKENFKKLSCFQDGVGNLEMDPARCDHEMFDTVQLDVNYPGVPPAEECVHLMKMRRDYSNIVCSGGEVVWNAKTPAPAPAAAQNSTDAAQAPAQNSTDGPTAPTTAQTQAASAPA